MKDLLKLCKRILYNTLYKSENNNLTDSMEINNVRGINCVFKFEWLERVGCELVLWTEEGDVRGGMGDVGRGEEDTDSSENKWFACLPVKPPPLPHPR